MTPPASDPQTPQFVPSPARIRIARPESGEEIVISGLSGTYPNSLNCYDFRDKLMTKTDLIDHDSRRWQIKHPEIPDKGGRIYEIEKFDAAFFGVHYLQAECMDPMARILLEKTFEALMDAGINPAELRGTKTGVFIGSCFSEAEKTWLYEQLHLEELSITGCIRTMLAKRLSYWFGIDGPSFILDTACSSSMFAIEQAYRAIRTGDCDAAIVGGCNLCLHPHVSLQFARLGVLNKDGKCKCFDEAADGYTRAEAIVVVILQKAKDCKRVVHAKTSCDGYKEQGITYPSGHMQTELLKEFYIECNVDPMSIEYIEAHGTGTQVGDPEELLGIETIFCSNERKTPLLIGSVKSNIGHTEPVSGLCSITKVILAMESGYLIPNINYNKPRPSITGLVDGRMKVVMEKTKWNGGYVPVSNFGFGGGNAHVLLKSNTKIKVNNGIPKDDIPRLVCLSGRTEEAINTIIDDFANRPMDAEYIGLLHESFKFDIPAHVYRGYGIFTKDKLLHRELDYYPYDGKPLWYAFSGLGAQWSGMGIQLMKIPVFAAAIERCHQVLSSKGLNIMDLITSTDGDVHSNLTSTVVAITAMQLGFVDLLTTVEVKPVGLIGYSIGELACAYCDGALTLEQAILCAYYLGHAADKCKNTSGAMVSVESGYENVKKYLASGLEIAAHNSEKNCIVSGPLPKMKEFVKKMEKQGIKVEEIDSKNICLHSSYVKDIATAVLKQLKELIPTPKERSPKWLSCSAAANKTKLCSAEFISLILVTPVLFEEVYDSVPPNAVILELSPRDLLQESLKRSAFDETVTVPMMLKNTDSTETVLSAIGKLYITGTNPRIEKIYPKISFPVSKSTPMLSPLIRWDHSHDWYVTRFEIQDKIKSGERTVVVQLSDEDLEYLAGHVIDGRTLYPATGYLTLIWETLGLIRGQLYTDLPVVFENVKFHRATYLPQKNGRVCLSIMIQNGSGNFEIVESDTAIVTGRAYIPEDISKEIIELHIPVPEMKDYYVPLNSRDIYKELRLRGYNYSGIFRGLESCDTTATVGHVMWKNNWVSCMDTIMQMQILQVDTRGLFVPTSIDRLVIDVDKHKECIASMGEKGTIPAYVYRDIKTVKCGGIEMRGLSANAIGRKKPLAEPVLETCKFIPYKTDELTLNQSIKVLVQTVYENILNNKVKTAEVLDDNTKPDAVPLSPIIQEILSDMPVIQAEVNVLTTKPIELETVTISDTKLESETNCLLVVASELLKRAPALQDAFNAIVKGGFVLTRESLDINLDDYDLKEIEIIADHYLDNERLILLFKTSEKKIQNVVDLSEVNEYKFEWLPILQNAVKSDPNTIVFAQGDSLNGIVGFVNCLRREPGLDGVRCVFILDDSAPKFDPNHEFYAPQLKKGLAMNVYKNGQWGCYRHLSLVRIDSCKAEHAYVNVTLRGDLSSLKWLQSNLSSEIKMDNNRTLVHVYYSALNFRDIMTATGRLAPEVVANGRFNVDCVQGLEFTGRLSDGRRMFGMLNTKALATMVSADSQLIWEVPNQWSFEEAITVPVVYGTVLYAFEIEGKIKRGMSVLIHAGSGGVGQAAINVALYYECTVYTTVGTPEKREFIKKTWPQLKDNQIGNSRDTSFEQMIMRETKGRGVDLVLNSLSEEKLQASLRCLARGGKFLEIGKFDLSANNPLSLNILQKEVSIHGIMLDVLFVASSSIKQTIHYQLASAIKQGYVKPLIRTVFKEDELEEAFRFMASGKHIGKVLIKIRDEEPELVIPPCKRLVNCVPRYLPTENGSYIITGGLGGFGLELVDWLVIRGAKKLVVTSRKGITTGYQAMRVRTWKSYGIDLIISTENIHTYDGCKKLIEQAMELGPVEGIFNLAVVLRDQLFENQTIEDYDISFNPKAVATKHLDQLSRELCPELRQFVVFSSVSCGRGNAGQTNYGMANSVMERICEERREAGFPALAIEWGAVGDVGLVAELQEEHTDVVIGGTLQQRINCCLSCMDQFLRQDCPIVASMVVAEKKSGGGAAENIVDAVANILGIRDIKTVSIFSTLAELGMDSIMAVEIKQTLEREFEVFLTPQDIRSMTFARLYEIAAEKEQSEVNASDQPAVTKTGLQFMLRIIGDEESSKKPVINYNTKASADCKEHVIMVSGIEGMGSIFETLAVNLKVNASCIQFGYENKHSSIASMAESVLDIVLEQFKDSSTFIIIGYSYGTIICLELVARLEARGKVGQVIFIDGAPNMLKAMASQHITSSDDLELQNICLSAIISLVFETEVINYIKPLFENLPTMDEKINCIIEEGSKLVKYKVHTDEHYKHFCLSIYARLQALLSYEVQFPKLKSTIKLIKPKQPSVATDEEDFGLSKYTESPVETVYVEGDHILILENQECAEAINQILFPEQVAFKEMIADKPDVLKEEAVRS
ncbi:Fatty acid synthase 3 [Carabus blaptoides fortunei]